MILGPVRTYPGSSTRNVTFQSDTDVTVIVSRSEISWTVYYNPTKRSLGKTFFSADDMLAHYKSIRGELRVAMNELG